MDKIYLWENETPYFDEGIGQERPSITPFLVDDGAVHGAMIVAPGGGYTMKAEHEGAPVALQGLQRGAARGVDRIERGEHDGLVSRR